MKKGQIFSVDLLLAATLVILFFGVIISTNEINNYEQKEAIKNIELKKSTEAVYYSLTNSAYSCNYNNINLPNSINITVLEYANNLDLRTDIGAIDKNYAILINKKLIKNNGSVVGKNVVSIDKNILLCDSNIILSDINNCIAGNNCIVNEAVLTLKVSG